MSFWWYILARPYGTAGIGITHIHNVGGVLEDIGGDVHEESLVSFTKGGIAHKLSLVTWAAGVSNVGGLFPEIAGESSEYGAATRRVLPTGIIVESSGIANSLGGVLESIGGEVHEEGLTAATKGGLVHKPSLIAQKQVYSHSLGGLFPEIAGESSEYGVATRRVLPTGIIVESSGIASVLGGICPEVAGESSEQGGAARRNLPKGAINA